MSTLKVDTIEHETATSAIDLPNKLKVGGAGVEQGYTTSETQPTDGEAGDFWWDSANEKIYRYIDGEFKELTGATTPSGPNWGGSRGLSVGGNLTTGRIASIDYFDLSVTSNNAQDFGDLLVGHQETLAGGSSNNTRGVWAGGQNPAQSSMLQSVMIQSMGNAIDWSNLTTGTSGAGSVSDSHGGLS